MSSAGEDIARLLFEIGAVTTNIENRYQFASGLRSPIYVDSRRAISHVTARQVILDGLARAATDKQENFSGIAGVATAGIPWAAWLADLFQLPLLYVRPASKNRGLHRAVEGHVSNLDQIIVVEDLVTTGASSVRAVEALRNKGASVRYVLSIFSYQLQYAQKNFDRANVEFQSLSGISELLISCGDLLAKPTFDALWRWKKEELPCFIPGKV
jgi:orotate phosphoribosyltransferase